VDLAQRDTLEYQINKRDERISNMQHDLQLCQSQLGQLQRDHTTLRRQQLESTHRHGIAIKLWKRTNEGLKARVECFERETTPAAAKEIASLIRDAAPSNKDSAYLMMLQDQLNKATVKLDHLGSQSEIVLHKGEEVVESLREEMNEVIRERSRMEIELLDQEKMLVEDKKRMIARTERRLKRVQGEIDFLEKKALEQLNSKTSEDEDDYEGGSQDEGEGETAAVDAGDTGKERDTEKNGTAEEQSTDSDADDTTQTPESLRQELRKLTLERDRTLSLIRTKLRAKNDEYMSLMRLKEHREREVAKLSSEKKERDDWKRSREGILAA
jgi:TolA-binding protein